MALVTKEGELYSVVVERGAERRRRERGEGRRERGRHKKAKRLQLPRLPVTSADSILAV